MRIAVLVTGEPRHFVETTQKLREFIVDKLRNDGHDVDVLLACWTTRTPPGAITQRHNDFKDTDSSPRILNYSEQSAIAEILCPRAVAYYDKPRVDVSYFLPHFLPTVNVYGMFCQHIGWQLGAQLIDQVETLHGFKYEAILRTRLDNHFRHPIGFPDLSGAGIRVPKTEGYCGSHFDTKIFCNDQMAVGSRNTMQRFLNIYRYYSRLQRAQKRYDLPEHMLCYYLDKIVGCGFKLFPLEYRLQRG